MFESFLLLFQRLVAGVEKLAGIGTDPQPDPSDPTPDPGPAPDPGSSDPGSWADKYDNPLFSPTIEKRYVRVTRSSNLKVFTGKFNDSGSPIFRVPSMGVDRTHVEEGQLLLVYKRSFLADGGLTWEVCDPSGSGVSSNDAEKID